MAAKETWEYMIVELNDPNANAKALNGLGAKGWELVSVACLPRGGGGGVLFAYLKRRT